MTADQFREIALSMGDAIERAHMRHPDFRAAGRIFATLDAQEQWGTVKLTPEEQGEFLRSWPAMFTPAAGAWGRQGWTRILLSAADAATARGAILLAWQSVVERPRNRRSSKPRPARAGRTLRKRRA